MDEHPWFKEFPGPITVCDAQGIIIEMNAKAIHTYENEGGERLIGSNLLDCHPEPARTKLMTQMENRAPNVYTIEKNGNYMLIFQTPWTVDGEYRGIMEIALDIPAEAAHFKRD